METTGTAVPTLEEQLADARAELDRTRRDYLGACKTIAEMHGAAVGTYGGAPKRGVVEDVADLRQQKDGAYAERNKVVIALAHLALCAGWNAGVREHPAEDSSQLVSYWRTIVLIDLPTGQVSWHFHDSEKPLLAGLPRYVGAWDGHTTEEKYSRLARLDWHLILKDGTPGD